WGETVLALWLLAALEGLRLADLVLLERVDGLLLDLREGRRHDEDRQEQGDADEHLVGRRALRAHALADEAQDDDDAREGGDAEEQRRDQRQPADEQQQLDGVLAVAAPPRRT